MQLHIRWAGTALLAVAILTLIIDTSFARGDLFDDDYSDCPSRIRLSEDQITSLTVSRNPEARSKVDVSWTATDPDTWGLGPNVYNTLFAIILDDKVNDPVEKTASLGTRSVTFDKVATHAKAEVQMAVVVAGESSDFVASDIIQANLVESLDEPLERPSFSSSWRYQEIDNNRNLVATESPDIPNGAFYYIGYNHGFVNYLATGDDVVTNPTSPRLRIGLRHEANTDSESLDMVDFKSYRIRILDENGDQVSASVTARSDSVGSGYVIRLPDTDARFPGGIVQLGFYLPRRLVGADKTIYNVRVQDDGVVFPASSTDELALVDDLLSFIRDEWTQRLIAGSTEVQDAIFTELAYFHVTRSDGANLYFQNYFHAPTPDEHADFPVDVMDSSETFTVEAWAVNQVGDALSPKATLKVRTDRTGYGAGTLRDRSNFNEPPIAITGSTVTQFLVIKSD